MWNVHCQARNAGVSMAATSTLNWKFIQRYRNTNVNGMNMVLFYSSIISVILGTKSVKWTQRYKCTHNCITLIQCEQTEIYFQFIVLTNMFIDFAVFIQLLSLHKFLSSQFMLEWLIGLIHCLDVCYLCSGSCLTFFAQCCITLAVQSSLEYVIIFSCLACQMLLMSHKL